MQRSATTKDDQKASAGVVLRNSVALIESVEARLVRVPLAQPTAFATRTVRARDYALVKLRTTDGLVGVGFCYAGSAAGNLVVSAIRDLLAPIVRGEDPYMVEQHWRTMYQESLLQGRTGAVA